MTKNTQRVPPPLTIGVLGGMGTYATINFFREYADVFPGEKEWDRPRIIIDNRCTMPSRVRAFLYNENKDKLITEMKESICGLVEMGCNKIILACNTSHLFLPKIIEQVPKIEQYLVNMIKVCVDSVERAINEDETVYLLGTEGTIDSGIYQEALRQKRRKCLAPEQEEYYLLRGCIEAVKQNVYSSDIKDSFLKLINRHDNCILGCTELPVLYDLYKEDVHCKRIFDPGLLVLKHIKECYFSQ